MEDYENLASDLLGWINKKIPEFEDRTTDNSLSNMQVLYASCKYEDCFNFYIKFHLVACLVILQLFSLQDKLNNFRNYKGTEKPPKVDDKSRLENLFNTLQTKLRLSNRPVYMPSDGKLISVSNSYLLFFISFRI